MKKRKPKVLKAWAIIGANGLIAVHLITPHCLQIHLSKKYPQGLLKEQGYTKMKVVPVKIVIGGKP